MKNKAKTTERFEATKQRHVGELSTRAKQIAKGKRRADRGAGLNRKDLEAIRDGRT